MTPYFTRLMIPGNLFIPIGGHMQDYFLGIDVSKGYADFVILDGKKQCVENHFQLDDTFNGHCKLYERLRLFCETHTGCTIYAAVESTGGYENNWFGSLSGFRKTLNLKIARLNPFGVTANSKASLKRIITDKISARNVAEYLIAHPEKVVYQQDDPTATLRKQWSFIKMMIKQKTQILNQLESLLYTANPELLIWCRNDISMWFLTLLTQYPTAFSLARARAKTVAKIPFITMERAEKLISNAKNSVASARDEVTGQLIVDTVRQIIRLKEAITDQIKKMTDNCSLPEVDLLKTFVGIGTFSAIGLILEIQTVKRFASVKKLSSYFGLHPEYKTSGDGSSVFRMCKRGRKEPRQILFMVTMACLAHNPLIRNLYDKHVEKGMEKMAAIGLCMHKILRIAYGMLKHNKPFDPETDLKNREKASLSVGKGKKNKARLYQDYDPQAPVSRRQNRKRSEQKQSLKAEHTIINSNVSAPCQTVNSLTGRKEVAYP
jgi:transposase